MERNVDRWRPRVPQVKRKRERRRMVTGGREREGGAEGREEGRRRRYRDGSTRGKSPLNSDVSSVVSANVPASTCRSGDRVPVGVSPRSWRGGASTTDRNRFTSLPKTLPYLPLHGSRGKPVKASRFCTTLLWPNSKVCLGGVARTFLN